MGTVTQEEKESFSLVKERLRILLERHLTNFRFVFPFGRPEGALKATISLLERVRLLISTSLKKLSQKRALDNRICAQIFFREIGRRQSLFLFDTLPFHRKKFRSFKPF